MQLLSLEVLLYLLFLVNGTLIYFMHGVVFGDFCVTFCLMHWCSDMVDHIVATHLFLIGGLHLFECNVLSFVG